jgi:hypothetical protein
LVVVNGDLSYGFGRPAVGSPFLSVAEHEAVNRKENFEPKRRIEKYAMDANSMEALLRISSRVA